MLPKRSKVDSARRWWPSTFPRHTIRYGMPVSSASAAIFRVLAPGGLVAFFRAAALKFLKTVSSRRSLPLQQYVIFTSDWRSFYSTRSSDWWVRQFTQTIWQFGRRPPALRQRVSFSPQAWTSFS